MKKFTFFLILFFPILCFAQNRGAKPTLQNSESFANKQQNVSRQPAAQVQNQAAYRPVNQAPVQREVVKTPLVYSEVSKTPAVNKESVVNREIPVNKEPRQDFKQEKPVSNDIAQIQKEKKPISKKPNLPPAPPGNYHVIYWTDFIDNQRPQQTDWATKLLDTKNLSLDGRGVQIAILDSGIKQHTQFNGANIEVLDVTGQNDPFDFCGHGTAVAGIIVGRKANEFKGIAPAVNLKSFKIADESGTTNNNYIISALENVLEYNRQNPQSKINIVNISYGLTQDNVELRNKLAEVYSSGVAIISASGNDGVQGLLYPANYNFVFAAGSIDSDRKLSPFSNWGEGLDFVLPGSGLMTLGLNNDFVWVKGTSFSSAYLTGIAALATQAFKNKYNRLPSPQELYEVLQKISTPIKAIAPIKQGYGVPDASKIVSYI